MTDTAPEPTLSGAPIDDEHEDLTRSTDGQIVPRDTSTWQPINRPVRITVAQRGWASSRPAKTADEVEQGLGVSYIDLEGFDPAGNPVTLRTAAIESFTLDIAGKRSFDLPIVRLPIIGAVHLVYVDSDRNVLSEHDFEPKAIPTVGWPALVEKDEILTDGRYVHPYDRPRPIYVATVTCVVAGDADHALRGFVDLEYLDPEEAFGAPTTVHYDGELTVGQKVQVQGGEIVSVEVLEEEVIPDVYFATVRSCEHDPGAKWISPPAGEWVVEVWYGADADPKTTPSRLRFDRELTVGTVVGVSEGAIVLVRNDPADTE